jgi:uncharacterized protein (TIGR02996 family)
MAGKQATTREALLRAVCDSPDDDAPRLVFADWLEENGDENERAWAEFIRVQCAAARLAADDPQREELRRRAIGLSKHHTFNYWQDRLPKGMLVRSVERGFPAKVRTSVLNFLRQGKRLFQVAPVQYLELTALGDRLDDLLASPLLGRLRGLGLGNEPLGDSGAAKLAACPHLAGLTALNVRYCRLHDAGVTALVTSPVLTRLTELDLHGARITPETREELRKRFGAGLRP